MNKGVSPNRLEEIAARVFAAAPDANTDREGNKMLNINIPENLCERHWRGHAETMRKGRTKYDLGDLLAVPALRKDGARISLSFRHPI